MMLDAFTLIAGPCVLEDDELNLEIGRQLALLSSVLGLPVVFKASFDKANRSRPGLCEGTRPGRGTRAPRAGQGRDRASGPHRHPRGGSGRSRSPGRRCSADPGVPLPPDRSVNCRGRHREGRQREEGAVDVPRRHAWCRGEGAARRVLSGGDNREGDLLRVWGPGRRHALLPMHCVTPAAFRSSSTEPTPYSVPARPTDPARAIRSSPPHSCEPLWRQAATGCSWKPIRAPGQAPSDSSTMLPLDDLKALLEEALAVRAALAGVRPPAPSPTP